jgi:hypothetical protein
MGVVYGRKPFIPSQEMFLYLDAQKYPGSGSSVPNLAGGTSTATLQNGTLWDGNSFYFDGIDDRIVLAYSAPANNFTFNFWIIPTEEHQIDVESTSGTGGTSGQKYLTSVALYGSPNSGAGISVGTNGVSVYEHSGSYMPALLVHQQSISTSVFTNICIVYNNKRPSLYINGVFARQGLQSLRTDVFMDGKAIGSGGSYGTFKGYLSVLQYYNRAITEREILANYLFFKPRYAS